MQPEDRERWKELCKKAAVENDPARLRELAMEIHRLETKAPKPSDGEGTARSGLPVRRLDLEEY
jgi:hypothetical protein